MVLLIIIMNQKLKQTLTVEDKFRILCPLWYSQIPKYKRMVTTSGSVIISEIDMIRAIKVGDKVIDLLSHKYCVIGEFYNFKDNYCNTSSRSYCETCDDLACGGTSSVFAFTRAIMDVAGDQSLISNHRTFIEFVKHVEEEHPKKCPWL